MFTYDENCPPSAKLQRYRTRHELLLENFCWRFKYLSHVLVSVLGQTIHLSLRSSRMDQPLDLSRPHNDSIKKKIFTIDYLTSNTHQPSHVSLPIKNELVVTHCHPPALYSVENQSNFTCTSFPLRYNEHVVPNAASPPLPVRRRSCRLPVHSMWLRPFRILRWRSSTVDMG